MQYWVRTIQNDGLPNLITAFDEHRKIREAELKQLQPWMDPQTNIVRVGGRLYCATLPEETKHPAILPAKNQYVQ